MNHIVNILLIAWIAVAVVDLSGAVDSLKAGVAGWMTRHGRATDAAALRLKPLDCSLCVTFWAGLVYLAVAGCFTLPMVAAVLGAAVLTPVLRALAVLVLDAALSGLDWITSKINGNG